MIDPLAYAPQTDSPIVVISDKDFGDVGVESESLEAAGARVVALQAKREEDLFDVAPDCAAMINQYARIGQAIIEHMLQCEVIALWCGGRYRPPRWTSMLRSYFSGTFFPAVLWDRIVAAFARV